MQVHKRGGKYLKDGVFGASDGILTTFAVVAGVVGANLNPPVVLILGIAKILADGFSMAAGNFLGSRSESQLYHRERGVEEWEMDNMIAQERKEIKEILAARGYRGQELETMLELIMENKEFAVDIMMAEEIGLVEEKDGRATRGALATFISFTVAGAIPLFPYLFFGSFGHQFLYAALFTGIALFFVGMARASFTGKSWIFSGLEMLVVGGVAAAIAYGAGFVLSNVITTVNTNFL